MERMSRTQIEALRSFQNSKWKVFEDCMKQLREAKSADEYSIIFDLNGYGDDDLVPDVFKRLRHRIEEGTERK